MSRPSTREKRRRSDDDAPQDTVSNSRLKQRSTFLFGLFRLNTTSQLSVSETERARRWFDHVETCIVANDEQSLGIPSDVSFKKLRKLVSSHTYEEGKPSGYLLERVVQTSWDQVGKTSPLADDLLQLYNTRFSSSDDVDRKVVRTWVSQLVDSGQYVIDQHTAPLEQSLYALLRWSTVADFMSTWTSFWPRLSKVDIRTFVGWMVRWQDTELVSAFVKITLSWEHLQIAFCELIAQGAFALAFALWRNNTQTGFTPRFDPFFDWLPLIKHTDDKSSTTIKEGFWRAFLDIHSSLDSVPSYPQLQRALYWLNAHKWTDSGVMLPQLIAIMNSWKAHLWPDIVASHRFCETMTPTERDVVRMWTSSASFIHGEDGRDRTNVIADLLGRAPRSTSPHVLYRGTIVSSRNDSEPQRFLATTLDVKIASKFAAQKQLGQVKKIRVPVGTPLFFIECVSSWSLEYRLPEYSESEVLLPAMFTLVPVGAERGGGEAWEKSLGLTTYLPICYDYVPTPLSQWTVQH